MTLLDTLVQMVAVPWNPVEARHNRQAPHWAFALFALCATGVATIWIDGGAFWEGYVLDMVGPAWTYILVRGRFTTWADNAWTRFFTPTRTVTILILGSVAIEGAQLLRLYDATFDPWDLVAYVSLLVPLYLVDASSSREVE